MPNSNPASLRCPGCGYENPGYSQSCLKCGLFFEANTGKPISTYKTSGSDLHPLALLQPGKTIEGIKILRSQNIEPGIVNTYLAETPEGVRIILKETVAGGQNERQFKQAHEVFSKLSNPALPVSYGCFKQGDRFYQSLLHKSGTTLQEAWLNNQSEEIRFSWINELCEAVFLLNQQNFLCLQLSPGNIVITEQGNLSIIDLPVLLGLPLSGSDLIATSFYVAPEVYSRRDEVSHRADVFAIGALWLSLLLKGPLQQSHFEDRFLRPPTELLAPTQILPSVNRLLLRATHPSLEKRYKSVFLLGKAIEQALADFRASRDLMVKYSGSPFLAAWTDMGISRDNNEDNFYAEKAGNENGSFTIATVADGMGGEEGGEVASSIARECIKNTLPSGLNYLKSVFPKAFVDSSNFQNRQTVLVQPDSKTELVPDRSLQEAIKRLLIDVVNESSKRIFDKAQHEQNLKSMGSTIVLAVVTGNQVGIANVGDSRAYLIRNGKAVQISQDHTRISEMRLNKKEPNQDELKRYQGVLSRNLGYRAAVDSYIAFYPIISGDYLLLCCDGLTDSLSDEQISRIITGNSREGLLPACFELINSAIVASGHDNTTVVLYRHP